MHYPGGVRLQDAPSGDESGNQKENQRVDAEPRTRGRRFCRSRARCALHEGRDGGGHQRANLLVEFKLVELLLVKLSLFAGNHGHRYVTHTTRISNSLRCYWLRGILCIISATGMKGAGEQGHAVRCNPQGRGRRPTHSCQRMRPLSRSSWSSSRRRRTVTTRERT